MDIPYHKTMISYEDLVKRVEEIKNSFNVSYLLNTYINKHFWTDRIKAHFQVKHVDNLSDFNYSKCFTLFINLKDENIYAGDQAMIDLIKKEGRLYRLEILISLLGPYIAYRYFQYSYENGQILLKSNEKPYDTDHRAFEKKIQDFCNQYYLKVIPEEILRKILDGVSLELAKDSVSIYNFFFEDSESNFPY